MEMKDVLKELNDEKKIRLDCWLVNDYVYRDGGLIRDQDGDILSTNALLNIFEGCVDAEIYEEPIKTLSNEIVINTGTPDNYIYVTFIKESLKNFLEVCGPSYIELAKKHFGEKLIN